MAGSNTTATICAWCNTKYNQFNNLSDTHKRYLKVAATVAAVGVASYAVSYSYATVLVSQASGACDSLLNKKRKLTLYQAIQAGFVKAIFTYDGIDDTHHGTQIFTGSWHGNLQYGTFFDTFSKDWETCWRKIIRLNVRGTVIRVPRALLSALADSTVQITSDDKLALRVTLGGSTPGAARHAGLHQVLEVVDEVLLESQSGIIPTSSSSEDDENLLFYRRIHSLIFNSLSSEPDYTMQDGNYVFTPVQLVYFYNIVVSSALNFQDDESSLLSDSETDDDSDMEMLESQSGVPVTALAVLDESDSRYWLSRYPEPMQKLLRKVVRSDMFDQQKLVLPKKFSKKKASQFIQLFYCVRNTLNLYDRTVEEKDIASCVEKFVEIGRAHV